MAPMLAPGHPASLQRACRTGAKRLRVSKAGAECWALAQGDLSRSAGDELSGDDDLAGGGGVSADAGEQPVGGDLPDTLLLAAFRRYTSGTDDHGNTFEVAEPHLAEADWPLLRSPDPRDALTASPFAAWGLAGRPAFVTPYLRAVGLLEAEGIHAAIRYALAECPS